MISTMKKVKLKKYILLCVIKKVEKYNLQKEAEI